MSRRTCSNRFTRACAGGVLAVAACDKRAPVQPHAPVAPVAPAAAHDGAAAPPDAHTTVPLSRARPFVMAVNTPNQFLAQGPPTFIVGTLGDDRADREILGQATLIRDGLFPTSQIVTDASIDAAKGPASWPANPVVYGGPAYNLLLARDARLPFTLTPGHLSIGSMRWDNPNIRMIAVVPAQGPHPTFLLYASTGQTGIAEINSFHHGPNSILIGDEFGALTTGAWVADEAGGPTARLSMPVQRPSWRTVSHALSNAQGNVHVNFLGSTAGPGESATVDACVAGTERAAAKIDKQAIGDVTFYVYPNRGAKSSVTSDSGDGHAIVAARVLHVIQNPPAAMENLVAHEATHVLVASLVGPAGSSCMGEGLAVWVSGQYGGARLAEWPARVPAPPPVSVLMTNAFRRMPEGQTYPWCGTLVRLAIDKVGIHNFLDHLLPATADTWLASVIAAGGRPVDLEMALRRSWPSAP